MKTFKTIDSYIKTFPGDIEEELLKIRRTIKTVVPKAEEAIKYGIPTFVLNSKNLVHFAGFKNHLGFYPGPKAIIAFKKELAKYPTSKGAIKFPIDKPAPLVLIKKITNYVLKNL